MVKVFQGTEQEFYLDGILKSNLDIAKSVIKQDWDMVSVYDGYEGSGKSVKALQDAFYCDSTLELDRVCFTPDEFKGAIIKAQQYQSVIFDEALTGLLARGAMSLVNRSLVEMLAEIRQKNLFVFVVLPSFFDLDRNVAIHRSRFLIHVEAPEFKRGFFRFYNADRKRELYLMGKKKYDHNVVKSNFYGRFTNHYPINQEEYRKKKLASLTSRQNIINKKHLTRDMMLTMFDRLQEHGPESMTHKEKMLILGMPEQTYYKYLREFKLREGIA